MHTFINPHSGSVLFIQRPKEVQAFLARQPHVLPLVAVAPGVGSKVLKLIFGLAIMLLVLIGTAVAFFLFGEERTRQVQRPNLTAQQRANAFRR
jgi:hypothetical protein